MIRIGPNIPNAPYYIPSKHISGANNFLESPPTASGIMHDGWTNQLQHTIYFGAKHYWHSLRYLPSNFAPSFSLLKNAPEIRYNNIIVLALPEGINNVYFIQYDECGHRKGYDTDIGFIGPYKIDITKPIGTLEIAHGLYRVEEPEVVLLITAIDTVSGVYQIYIDGDVLGDNVRKWIEFNEQINVMLNDAKTGRKIVTIRLKDWAGNISNLITDDVFLSFARYYFYPAPIDNNFAAKSDVSMYTKQDNLLKTDMTKNISEGAQYGEFNAR